MNRARLQELGFDLGARAAGGRSQGAWFATTRDGAPVVLKWSPGETMAGRYAALLPGLDELRVRGAPVPEYLHVGEFDGGVLSVQRRLPGRSEDNPSPAVSAAVLERAEAVGAAADPAWFPDDGLVHRDLHTDNVLIDGGALSGIIDWEEACAGDHRFDLVAFAFDLDGHGQPIWDRVDAAGFEAPVLRAYVGFLVLKCTASAILHHPEDVPRQLDRAERVFDRYGF
jgi:hypothetical protein